jgi:hypothetical protein
MQIREDRNLLLLGHLRCFVVIRQPWIIPLFGHFHFEEGAEPPWCGGAAVRWCSGAVVRW